MNPSIQAIYHRVYPGMFGHICRDTMFRIKDGVYLLRMTSTDPREPAEEHECDADYVDGWLASCPEQVREHTILLV